MQVRNTPKSSTMSHNISDFIYQTVTRLFFDNTTVYDLMHANALSRDDVQYL